MAQKDSDARRAYQREYRRRKRAEVPGWRERERAAVRRGLGIVAAPGEARSGLCPLCGRDGALNCDHDHATGAVRGWICRRCNMALGLVEDRPERLRAMAAYLEQNVPSSDRAV